MSKAADNPKGAQDFTAGRLRATFACGDLRYLSLGSVETIRRLYVGVRDANWGTVEPSVSDVVTCQAADGFRIDFNAHHTDGNVDFAWHGRIVARSSGADGVVVRYEMDGTARSTFRTNRTGICLLHPLSECVGAACSVEHSDGSLEACRFPVDVAPRQPFIDVRAMEYSAGGSVAVGLRFEGEVFETEDQRNWSDGSLKTYCRPLSEPFPYLLERGQRVWQAVEVMLKGSPGAELIAPPVLISLQAGRTVSRVPPVGFMLSNERPSSPGAALLLRAMRPSHLRVQLQMNDSEWESLADAAVDAAGALECPLEMAVHRPRDAGAWIEPLAAWARRSRPDVCRWIVFENGMPVTSAGVVALARCVLTAVTPSAPVGGGTIGNFAEVNRAREVAATLGVLSYPINPQAHAADDLSLMENLEGQAPSVSTSWSFAPGVPLAVGPVTLHRRPDPFAAGKGGAGTEAVFGDPRQKTLFGAAWTLGSFKALAEAGVDALTYYETLGPFGVMDDATVFPLYHVLADVAEFVGGEIVGVNGPSLRTCAALAMRRHRDVRVVIANTQDRRVNIRLDGLSGYQLEGRLDLTETTLPEATGRPLEFRSGAARGATGDVPSVVDLPPYAVVRLDLTERV